MALVVLIAALMIFVPFAASTSSAEPSSADDGFSIMADDSVTEENAAAKLVTSEGVTTYYASLSDAVDAMKNTDTVKLLMDVTGLQTINVTEGKAVTVDLNGHSISFAFQNYFYVENGSLTLTGEGTVSEQNNNYWYAPVMIRGSTDPDAEVGYSEVVIGSSVVLKGWAGIFVNNSVAVPGCAYGVKVDFDGTIISGRDTANDAGHGIYVNGNIDKEKENAPVIEVSGDITSEGDGIYAAGYSHWRITDGTTIEAPLGMEIRAGTLEISGGSIVSTGEFVEPGPNGNGTSASSGVALSIAQHTTKKPIEVSITGGTLSGPYAVYQANPQNNDADALAGIEISVTGGTFVSDGEESRGVADIYSENFTGFVQGGRFASIPYEYLSDEAEVAVDAEGNAYVGDSVPKEGVEVMQRLTGDKIVTDTWDLGGKTIYTGPYRVVIDRGKVINGTLYTDVVTTDIPSVVVVLNGEISNVTVEGGYRAVAVENVGGVPNGKITIDIKAKLGATNDAVYINNVSGVNVFLDLDILGGKFDEGAVAVHDYAGNGHVTISSLTGYDDIGLYIYAMGHLALGTNGTAGTIVMPAGTVVEVVPLSGCEKEAEVELVSSDLVVLDPEGIIGEGESSSGVVTIDSQEKFEKVLSRLDDYVTGTVFEFETGAYDVTADRPNGTYGSAFVITKDGLTFRAAEGADVTIYGFSNFFNSDVKEDIHGQSTVYIAAKDTTLQGLTILPLGGYGSEAVFETQTVLVAAGADADDPARRRQIGQIPPFRRFLRGIGQPGPAVLHGYLRGTL